MTSVTAKCCACARPEWRATRYCKCHILAFLYEEEISRNDDTLIPEQDPPAAEKPPALDEPLAEELPNCAISKADAYYEMALEELHRPVEDESPPQPITQDPTPERLSEFESEPEPEVEPEPEPEPKVQSTLEVVSEVISEVISEVLSKVVQMHDAAPQPMVEPEPTSEPEPTPEPEPEPEPKPEPEPVQAAQPQPEPTAKVSKPNKPKSNKDTVDKPKKEKVDKPKKEKVEKPKKPKVDKNDPNHVKAAKSAWLWFCADMRAQFKANPNGMAPTAITGEIARLWEELKTDPQRLAKYTKMAEDDKVRFKRDTAAVQEAASQVAPVFGPDTEEDDAGSVGTASSASEPGVNAGPSGNTEVVAH